MKQPVQKFKQVAYWACSIPGHEHQSERTALSCIMKSAHRVKVLNIPKRDIEITLMVIDGHTHKQAGEKFNLSEQHVGSIARGIKYRAKRWGFYDRTTDEKEAITAYAKSTGVDI